MQAYEYYKSALEDVDKPCAYLDIDVFTQNIKQIAESNNQKNIRIASKSIRSVGILKRIFDASPVFKGVMCFTADEAIHLHSHGFDDVLIAYPVWNTYHLEEISKRVHENATITVTVDSYEHIDHLENIAKKAGRHFLVCMEIDLSSDIMGLHFGVHRSPIKTVDHAVAVAKRIDTSPYLTLDGVMGYEGQIAGVTDNNPYTRTKNKLIKMLKKKSSKEFIPKRKQIIDSLKSYGIDLRFVNGGGTGSLEQTTSEDVVTEVTVGSGFFSPHLFDYYTDFRYQPAVGFAVEITRKPAPKIYTCLGGGYVASGASGKDRLPVVHLPSGAKLTANEGAGEVQTPIYYDGNIELNHGDPIIMRHSKSGELCERFPELHLIENGKIVGTEKTYRGEHKCFL